MSSNMRLKPEQVATGFQFTEGPVWHPDGFLLFSDTPANRIYKLDATGQVSVYLEKSGLNHTDTSLLSDMVGSNGLAVAPDRSLIICQHGNHALAKLLPGGTLTTIVGRYGGRPFNSPNDVLVANDGAIYFTDPPYGLKEQVLNKDHFQPVAGVYCLDDDEVFLLGDDFHYPNGLCFSSNGRHLFVSSNHPDEALVWKYTIGKKKEVVAKEVFIRQNGDGISMDKDDNLFMATSEGILAFSPSGEEICSIVIPEEPTNMAWSDNGLPDLYITARTSIYCVKGFHL